MAVITISRQFGAGGITLGELVSKKLGYRFFDNEIIQMVADKAKVSTNWVESMEKEAGGKIQRLLSGMVSKRLVDRILDMDHGYIDEEIYVDLLHQIIRKIAVEGDAVILGRGSQYILHNEKDTFHVLLVADKEYRIGFIEEKYHLKPRQAVQMVNNEDKRRVNLYQKFGRLDYDSTAHYHLILNMRRVPVESAAELMCRLVNRGR